MLPLVTNVEEVVITREWLQEEAAALAKAGIRAAASVPVGVMIETPAAVLIADLLAGVSEFFSVGTNDLVQYTLAVDRGNARLADRFAPHHPAVVRQLQAILRAGRDAGIGVSVCGEMASDPLSVLLLVGLGYTDLSVSPPSLPLIKWVVRTVPYAVLERAAQAALAATRAEEVTRTVLEAVQDHIDVRCRAAAPGLLSHPTLSLTRDRSHLFSEESSSYGRPHTACIHLGIRYRRPSG
jgi:phosphotransferase system enzyme I (PtsI)